MHVGIIMDGNGRWAEARGVPRAFGHKRGADRAKEIIRACPPNGVETLTLYAFSTENWKRSPIEVAALMQLFRGFLRDGAVELHSNNVRVCFLGNSSRLASDIRRMMATLSQMTSENNGLRLNIAINYGGRDELVRAMRKIAKKIENGGLTSDGISEELVSAHLDTFGQSDPDLIIRTSGELRLSNFLTWQSVYSEFAFIPEQWPDITDSIFQREIEKFGKRTRQFGASKGVSP